ncbi:RNA polymerase subunit sigma-70 [Aerococcaceae bacterium NML191219]|nr:RNA polymerase subunit sigma-70 [Aerococcaceae bacterium NML191219]
MDKTQKDEIRRLRKNGLGYKRIATILSMSLNTVKAYCRRECIEKEVAIKDDGCLLCGEQLHHTKGKKQKKFCSDQCRMKWWNQRLDKVNRKSFTVHQCLYCKKEFCSYANPSRKYCSHACYIDARFGGDCSEK